MSVSLATIAERMPAPEVFVDYNGNERDPAWQAVCSDLDDNSYWQGVWHHAEDYVAWGEAMRGELTDGADAVWQAARAAAERAAEDEGDAHRADVHHD